MVFDVRGRRKHVVRAVYAILAVLMGASLFLVVGPFSIGNLIGNSGGQKSAGSIDQEQVQRIEERLRRDPKNEGLLLSLTRAHIIAAGALSELNPETGLPSPTPEAIQEYGAATVSWQKYVKQAHAPSPAAARQVAETYVKIAEVSASVEEANANIRRAAKTMRIAAKAQPSLGALTLLATYEYFSGNYAEGDRLSARASKKTTSATEAKEVTKKLAETRTRAKAYEKEVREFKKTEKEKGKEALKNPLGGLGGSPSIGG
jgi:hypothetical protein